MATEFLILLWPSLKPPLKTSKTISSKNLRYRLWSHQTSHAKRKTRPPKRKLEEWKNGKKITIKNKNRKSLILSLLLALTTPVEPAKVWSISPTWTETKKKHYLKNSLKLGKKALETNYWSQQPLIWQLRLVKKLLLIVFFVFNIWFNSKKIKTI